MSELIRVRLVDDRTKMWTIAREIFRLNLGGILVEDIIPVDGKEEFDVQISDGMRALVIAKLGQIAAITLVE